jgi:hypothetical protein
LRAPYVEVVDLCGTNKAATRRRRGFFAVAEIVDLGPQSTTAAIELLLIGDHLCGRFARLKLDAYLMDLRSLLIELRRENFHLLLLLTDDRFLPCSARL